MKDVDHTQLNPVTVQVSVFTPDFSVSTRQVTVELLGGAWAEIEGEPMMFPAAQGIPPDIPKLILRDENKGWQFEVADARLNIKWRATTIGPSGDTGAIIASATEYAKAYTAELKPRVGRLAAVVQSFAKHSSPGLYLAHHFCKERWHSAPLNRPEAFEIHAHKKYSFGEFTVNSWVRCKTATMALGPVQDDGVLVEQDLNTLPEQAPSKAFTEEEISDFFASAPGEFAEILKLYFPES